MKKLASSSSLLLLIIFLMFNAKANAQSYVGHLTDNYSGIHGVVLNPASVVDSRFRTDINLFSASGFLGSDYFGINIENLANDYENFNFDEEVKRFPRDQNNFFLNLDVLGPSFMFNLNKKSSIAVTTRLRAFFNVNNVNGRLFEGINENFDYLQDFDFEMRNLNGSLHAWGELGLTYGRILMDKERHFLKAGVTFKYLQGAGSSFFNASSVTGQYNASAHTLQTAGSMSYGNSREFDSDDVDFKNLSSGFGGDIGLVYEFRPVKVRDSVFPQHSNYRFKIGISVTDIGSIDYGESTVTTYNLNSAIDANSFEENGFEDVLENQYSGTQETITSRIALPTAFHLHMDYLIARRWYVGVNSSLSLIGADKEQASRILNSVTINPRFETKWFSMYLPISYRQYDGFAMGTGLRFGPFTVGSGSIITNYLAEDAMTTDVFFGVKIPIYR